MDMTGLCVWLLFAALPFLWLLDQVIKWEARRDLDRQSKKDFYEYIEDIERNWRYKKYRQELQKLEAQREALETQRKALHAKKNMPINYDKWSRELKRLREEENSLREEENRLRRDWYGGKDE